MNLSVEFPPFHPAQQQVIDSPARFKIVTGGRRSGKTAMGVIMCLAEALDGGRTWWVAPSLGNAEEGWMQLTMHATQIPQSKVLLGDRTVALPGGGSVAIKTASEPYRLRGSGLDGLVIDESAWLKEESWTQALRPALTDRRGWATMISTPFGKDNWFYDLWEKVPNLKGWERFSMPTSTNPTIDPDEIEEARLLLHPLDFAQEYLGEFVVRGGQIFKSDWLRYYEDAPEFYFLGPRSVLRKDCWRFVTVDPAASKKTSADYTVIGVWDVTQDTDQILVDMVRGRLEAPEIIDALKRVYNEYLPGYIGVEKNGLGLPIIQYALKAGLPIRPIEAGKEDLQARAMPAATRMSQEKIWFPRGKSWLAELERELLAFPSAAHDDIVSMISMAAIEIAGGLRSFDMSDLVSTEDYEIEDEDFVVSTDSDNLVETLDFEDWIVEE